MIFDNNRMLFLRNRRKSPTFRAFLRWKGIEARYQQFFMDICQPASLRDQIALSTAISSSRSAR